MTSPLYEAYSDRVARTQRAVRRVDRPELDATPDERAFLARLELHAFTAETLRDVLAEVTARLPEAGSLPFQLILRGVLNEVLGEPSDVTRDALEVLDERARRKEE